MPATLRVCRNCGADISDKAPNAFKCNGCLAPRRGTERPAANALRVDVLGSTGGFPHETPTLEQWQRLRAQAPLARAGAVTGDRARPTRGMSL